MNREANEALLRNIKLLNIIAYKIDRSNIEDARQVVYETFLKNYNLYNKTKGSLSNYIYSSIRLKAINKYDEVIQNVKRPFYVREIHRKLSQGVLTGDMNEFEELKKNNIYPFCNINKENYQSIVNSFSENRYAKSYVDDSLEDTNIEYNSTELNEPERIIEDEMFSNKLQKAINKLPDREKFIITNYYGIGNKNTKTLQELGNIIGYSMERVRQVKVRALARLYNSLIGTPKNIRVAEQVRIYLNSFNNNKNKKGQLYGTN